MGTYVPYDATKEQSLNNFYLSFPYSAEGQGLVRVASAVFWDITFREVYRGMCRSEQEFQQCCSEYSNKHLNQTPGQFFAELDSTVIEVGHNLGCIAEKIRAYGEVSEHCLESDETLTMARKLSKELEDYLTPVYVALRLKGYNRKELYR